MDALRTLAPWLAASPLPWLVLTLVAYALALALYRRSGAHPLLIPVLTAVAAIVALLMLSGTPYATYRRGVELLNFMIGPATVALAVPLFAQRGRIRQLWRPIGAALLVGCVVAIVSACCWPGRWAARARRCCRSRPSRPPCPLPCPWPSAPAACPRSRPWPWPSRASRGR